jgi:hypothetical protein
MSLLRTKSIAAVLLQVRLLKYPFTVRGLVYSVLLTTTQITGPVFFLKQTINSEHISNIFQPLFEHVMKKERTCGYCTQDRATVHTNYSMYCIK